MTGTLEIMLTNDWQPVASGSSDGTRPTVLTPTETCHWATTTGTPAYRRRNGTGEYVSGVYDAEPPAFTGGHVVYGDGAKVYAMPNEVIWARGTGLLYVDAARPAVQS